VLRCLHEKGMPRRPPCSLLPAVMFLVPVCLPACLPVYQPLTCMPDCRYPRPFTLRPTPPASFPLTPWSCHHRPSTAGNRRERLLIAAPDTVGLRAAYDYRQGRPKKQVRKTGSYCKSFRLAGVRTRGKGKEQAAERNSSPSGPEECQVRSGRHGEGG